MLTTCPKCGAKAMPDRRTCAFCGASLLAGPTPPPAPPPAGPTPDDGSGVMSPLAPPFPAAAPDAPPPYTTGGRFSISRRLWMIGGPILAVILVVVVIGFVRGSSLTGEWTGPISVTAVALTVPDGEAYLDLRQGGDGSITGSGSACLITGSAGTDFTVTGRVSNATLTLALGLNDQPDIFDQYLAGQYTGTVSGQSLQLTATVASGSGTITLKMRPGSRGDYDAACQNPAAAS